MKLHALFEQQAMYHWLIKIYLKFMQKQCKKVNKIKDN